MFAKSRIDKLTGLNTYEINSIGTSRNANTIEVPGGKNNAKKCIPWILIQTMLIPIKTAKLNANVTIRWLVNVKLYGTSPIKFRLNMKRNIENTKGYYALHILW